MITRRTKAEERRAYLLLVLPAVLLYFAVVAFPMIFSLWISVSDYSGGQIFGGSTPVRFAGFQLRPDVERPLFWISLRNNVYIVLISVFGQIPLGFILAYALHRNMFRAKVFQTVIYYPVSSPRLLLVFSWQTIFRLTVR